MQPFRLFEGTLFTILLLPVLVATGIAQVTVAIPDTTAGQGTSIAIPVRVDDVSGKNIISVGMTLEFNQGILTADTAIVGGTIAESWGNPTFNASEGEVSIGMAGTSALSGGGKLILVHFKVAGNPDDTTTIRFADLLFNEGEPAAESQNGLFTVAGEQNIDTVSVSIPDTTARKNQRIKIPIWVNDVTGLGIFSAGVALSFDANVLDSARATTRGTICEAWSEPTFNSDNPGKIVIASAGSVPLTGDGALLYVDFYVSGAKGRSTDIRLHDVIFNEGDPIARSTAGSITVINSPPDTFSLHLPLDRSVTDTLNPTLKWFPANDVDKDSVLYSLFLNTDILFANSMVMDSLKDTTHTLLSGLEASTAYYWKVVAIDREGDSTWCSRYFQFTTSETATNIVDQPRALLPDEFRLYQNFPNPFNPETTIKYQLPTPSEVTINIYNVTGQRIRTLTNQKQSAGYYSVVWNGKDDAGRDVSSGVYFYQLQAKGGSGKSKGNFVETRKMVLVR